jgi:Na+-transporting methylmalonyl-CoA/oxaloacetate decarboxylase gamma subunit
LIANAYAQTLTPASSMPDFLSPWAIVAFVAVVLIVLAAVAWQKGWLGAANEESIKAEIAALEAKLKAKAAEKFSEVLAAAPAAIVPAAASRAMLPAYVDRDDLMIAIGANNCQQAILLDKKLVHGGLSPEIHYATQPDGSIAFAEMAAQ